MEREQELLRLLSLGPVRSTATGNHGGGGASAGTSAGAAAGLRQPLQPPDVKLRRLLHHHETRGHGSRDQRPRGERAEPEQRSTEVEGNVSDERTPTPRSTSAWVWEW